MASKGRGNYATKQLILSLKEYGNHMCHLCGEPIDMGLCYPHRRAWSLDHVIPLGKGGHPSDPANGRESHWECNVQRGDMDLAAWHARLPRGTFHLA